MTVPALRSVSPVAGLRRRRLGPLEVLAQSVAATAPAAAMATSPGQAFSLAGAPPSALAYLAATVLVLLVSSCVGQFSRRMVAPGSLYSFTAKGLGGTAGTVAGGFLVVGYGFLVAGALTGAATSATGLVERVLPPGWAGTGLEVGVLVVLGVLVAGVAVRGAGISARLGLVLELLSISVVLVVLGVVVAASVGRDGAPAPETLVGGNGHPFGPGGQGLLLAVTAFVGFESAGSLATESRRPLAVVPRAVRWTAVVSGVLYVVAAAAQSVVFAATPGSQKAPLPLAAAVGVLTGPTPAAVLEVGILTSFVGCASASLTALVRLLFTMGREGVGPRAWGATGRFGTPAVAVVVSTGLAVVVPAGVLVAGAPVGEVLRGLLVVGTCGYVGGYVLVCAAAPVFLRRIGELTVVPVVVAAVATGSLAAVLAACVAWSVAAGGGWVLAAVALLALSVLRAVVLRWRRPALLAGVGLYDETRRQDVLS